MVTTSSHEVVYQNDAWVKAESSESRREIARYTRSDFHHKVSRIGEHVLHGHRLDGDSPIWSNGNIFFIERCGADSIKADLGAALDAVASRYRLSPRECELFKMALQGRNTRCIAEQLGLSVGTVKNYKQRLYAKLSVKCEREIVPLLMNFMGDRSLPSKEMVAI
jgi:DNA-binding CsgD family transcriptional regulator